MQLLRRITQTFANNGPGKLHCADPIKAMEYCLRVQKRCHEDKTLKKLDSIQTFKKMIYSNPDVRFMFQGALNSIPKVVREDALDICGLIPQPPRQGVLYGKTLDQVLDMMNCIAQTPPTFSDQDIIGVPFFAIFIDLLNNGFGQALFAKDSVNRHLKNIFNDYSAMLKSPKSLTVLTSGPDGWLSPQAVKRVDYNDFKCDPNQLHYGFKSWNAWFTRELRKNARPIDESEDVIVNNSENYPLITAVNPRKYVQKADKFWLKQNSYSLMDMLGGYQDPSIEKIIDENFADGTVYQGFLNPWCYHRWHSPIKGKVLKSYILGDNYYLDNPNRPDNQKDNYINSQPLLSMVSKRQVFIIDSENPKIGKIGVIQIGMAEVSGIQVNKPFKNIIEGQEPSVKKGQELGYFEFGGSSHAIIFDKRLNGKLNFNEAIDYRIQNKESKLYESVLQKVNSPLATIV